jgi:hypothetical protein
VRGGDTIVGSMSCLQDAFRRWTECLLDPKRTPIDQLRAAQCWHDWALDVLGIDENAVPDWSAATRADTHLPTGKAISPLGAVRCLREYRRTAVFLQAMDRALREARRRFPGETLHVVEAGCGPAAPLVLPFAVRYPPEEVMFTLLDLHAVSLEAARSAVEALGVAKSIRGYVAADATRFRFPNEDRPHVIACEVLLRALKREPQVAVTMALAPQRRPGGLFLPERIEVEAALFSSRRHVGFVADSDAAAGAETARAIPRLGTVFSLDAMRVGELVRKENVISAQRVVVPPHDRADAELHLMTDLRVFGEHRLGDLESSLNLPERVEYPDELAQQGGTIDFEYQIQGDPGLRVTRVRLNGDPSVG